MAQSLNSEVLPIHLGKLPSQIVFSLSKYDRTNQLLLIGKKGRTKPDICNQTKFGTSGKRCDASQLSTWMSSVAPYTTRRHCTVTYSLGCSEDSSLPLSKAFPY